MRKVNFQFYTRFFLILFISLQVIYKKPLYAANSTQLFFLPPVTPLEDEAEILERLKLAVNKSSHLEIVEWIHSRLENEFYEASEGFAQSSWYCLRNRGLSNFYTIATRDFLRANNELLKAFLNRYHRQAEAELREINRRTEREELSEQAYLKSLAALAFKFPFTDASHEALMILSAYELNRESFESAQIILSNLLNTVKHKNREYKNTVLKSLYLVASYTFDQVTIDEVKKQLPASEIPKVVDQYFHNLDSDWERTSLLEKAMRSEKDSFKYNFLAQWNSPLRPLFLDTKGLEEFRNENHIGCLEPSEQNRVQQYELLKSIQEYYLNSNSSDKSPLGLNFRFEKSPLPPGFPYFSSQLIDLLRFRDNEIYTRWINSSHFYKEDLKSAFQLINIEKAKSVELALLTSASQSQSTEILQPYIDNAKLTLSGQNIRSYKKLYSDLIELERKIDFHPFSAINVWDDRVWAPFRSVAYLRSQSYHLWLKLSHVSQKAFQNLMTELKDSHDDVIKIKLAKTMARSLYFDSDKLSIIIKSLDEIRDRWYLQRMMLLLREAKPKSKDVTSFLIKQLASHSKNSFEYHEILTTLAALYPNNKKHYSEEFLKNAEMYICQALSDNYLRSTFILAARDLKLNCNLSFEILLDKYLRFSYFGTEETANILLTTLSEEYKVQLADSKYLQESLNPRLNEREKFYKINRLLQFSGVFSSGIVDAFDQSLKFDSILKYEMIKTLRSTCPQDYFSATDFILRNFELFSTDLEFADLTLNTLQCMWERQDQQSKVRMRERIFQSENAEKLKSYLSEPHPSRVGAMVISEFYETSFINAMGLKQDSKKSPISLDHIVSLMMETPPRALITFKTYLEAFPLNLVISELVKYAHTIFQYAYQGLAPEDFLRDQFKTLQQNLWPDFMEKLAHELSTTQSDSLKLNLLYFIAAQGIDARDLSAAVLPLMRVQNSVVRHKAMLTLQTILPEAIEEISHYRKFIEESETWPQQSKHKIFTAGILRYLKPR